MKLRQQAVATAALTVLLSFSSGCAVEVPPTSPSARSSLSASASPAVLQSDQPSPDLQATDAPPAYDPTQITQFCESWGAGASDRTIRCSRGLKAVLDSLGPTAAGVERIYLGFKPRCDPLSPTCPARRENRAVVAIHSRAAGDLVVEVTLGPDGGYVTTLPIPDPSPPVSPEFANPRRAVGLIRGPQPVEVRERDPLPLCGVETADLGGPWATDSRRCFLNRVLAGQPTEFVSQGRGTEGDKLATIFRFGGGGAVTRYDRDDGAWTWTACGLALLRTDVVFATDGICRRRDLEVSR